MAVVGEQIPKELLARQQWVAARITPDPDPPGKSDKRPIDPHTGGPASTTNPDTWGSFDEALAAAERLPAGTGAVGFVFTAEDPYCGVDFDHCYEAGRVTEETLGWVRQLDSYTEKSISGEGLHVICKGKLPPGGRRKGQVEMYDRSRFFVMTGNALPGMRWVNERTPALAKLHRAIFGAAQEEAGPTEGPPSGRRVALPDDELLSRARQAANGDAFDRLWRGDTSAGRAAANRPDLAECPPLPAAARLVSRTGPGRSAVARRLHRVLARVGAPRVRRFP